MTNLIIRLVLLSTFFFMNVMQAQEFTGRAIYESKAVMKDVTMKVNGADASPAELEEFQAKLNKMGEKTYILDFNKTESVYSEEEKLEAGGLLTGLVTFSNSDGKVYKNVQSKVAVIEEEFFGKEFLITDSLRNWNWRLEPETKKIGNYTCYKAVSIDEPTPEDWARYEEQKKKQSQGQTSFFVAAEPKQHITTVWYTPEIPVSQGPEKFWGLPGLILEANFFNTTVLCSRIILNPTEKVIIKMPKRGKKVTKKEYDSLITKHMEQMQDGNGNITIELKN